MNILRGLFRRGGLSGAGSANGYQALWLARTFLVSGSWLPRDHLLSLSLRLC